jgi:hypothetical protein
MSAAQQKPTTPYQNVPRTQQVRPIERKLNTDWEYLNEGETSPYASNDETFNASYKKRGLQPQPLGKVNTNTAPANDNSYTNSTQAMPTQRRNFQSASTPTKKAKAGPSTAMKLFARTKASAVNMSILLWGSTLWLAVQIPFGLISLVMFGLTGVAQAAATSSGFASVALWVADRVLSAAGFLFGFDASVVSMSEGFALATYILVLAVGLLSIFTAYLQYTMAFLRPLSGEEANLKIGVLLFVIFGYSVPLLNLFPWILLWMAVVWKYPK